MILVVLIDGCDYVVDLSYEEFHDRWRACLKNDDLVEFSLTDRSRRVTVSPRAIARLVDLDVPWRDTPVRSDPL